jgi:5-methyltetrahydrofolate--homocysteine methyltransferase
MSQELINAIVEMREADALAVTKQLLDAGTAPMEVLDACRNAMDVIGGLFERGEAFIPELMLAGEMLTAVSALIKPRMTGEAGVKKLGKIVLGTVEGDIHDIAKDIVAFMLDINGFDVTDLGVDVPPAKFVEAVEDTGAEIVGLSGFLTLAYEPMKETVAAIKKAGLDKVKVMIGGGQIDEQVREYTGAAAFGRDAMAAVNLAKEWV